MSEPAPQEGVWYARRDGRRVARIRCVEAEGSTQVECEVYALNDPDAELTPSHPGPYHFATAGEALKFAEEAVLALRYLGCEIA